MQNSAVDAVSTNATSSDQKKLLLLLSCRDPVLYVRMWCWSVGAGDVEVVINVK